MRHSAACRAKVKFRDFRALSQFIDAWGSRDGVTVEWVEWTLTEERQRREADVLARAVENAKSRAQTMATAAGAGEVRFLELSDPGLLGTTPVSESFAQARAMKAYDASGGEGVDLQPEDVELNAQVQARFTTD